MHKWPTLCTVPDHRGPTLCSVPSFRIATLDCGCLCQCFNLSLRTVRPLHFIKKIEEAEQQQFSGLSKLTLTIEQLQDSVCEWKEKVNK